MPLGRRGLLLGLTALAAGAHRVAFAAAPGEARLVVVILRGGLDGLAAVQPYGAPLLVELRAPLTLSGGWPDRPRRPLWAASRACHARRLVGGGRGGDRARGGGAPPDAEPLRRAGRARIGGGTPFGGRLAQSRRRRPVAGGDRAGGWPLAPCRRPRPGPAASPARARPRGERDTAAPRPRLCRDHGASRRALCPRPALWPRHGRGPHRATLRLGGAGGDRPRPWSCSQPGGGPRGRRDPRRTGAGRLARPSRSRRCSKGATCARRRTCGR